MNTSFEAEREVGRDCASSIVSVSNSAKMASSIAWERLAGIIITFQLAHVFPHSDGKSQVFKFGCFEMQSYSPGATVSNKNSPCSLVTAVRSPGVSTMFTLSIVARVVRDTTTPFMPPPV